MEPQREPVGAPERLDVPFELKTIQTLTGDDGVEVGVFEGLASTFGNQDMVGDVVEPGAFAATIARPGRIKMLWQHDARAPIGVWEDIRETAAGQGARHLPRSTWRRKSTISHYFMSVSENTRMLGKEMQQLYPMEIWGIMVVFPAFKGREHHERPKWPATVQ